MNGGALCHRLTGCVGGGPVFNFGSRLGRLGLMQTDVMAMKDMTMQTMMRGTMAVLLGLGGMAAPSMAKSHHNNQQTRYEYNGNYYNSLEECREKKNKAKKDGAIVGAATAGVGAAILGANLGEAALIAGGGALVGNQIGKSKKC